MAGQLRYHPDRDQIDLVAAIEPALTDLLPIARLRREWHETEVVWTGLGALGLFDLAIPEEGGGSGLGAVEEALIAIALGRRLIAPAVLTTLAVAHLPAVVRPVRAAAGFGNTLIREPGATAMLLRNEGGMTLYSYPEAITLDDGLWAVALAKVTPQGAPLACLDETGCSRVRLIDAGALAGIAAATLDMAVDYAKTREQFGRSIGSFQAIKHHCANMAIAARAAHDLVTFAAVALDDARTDTAMLVEAAFLTACTAAIDNAGTNIQIHGGFGFSEEADPHLFLKRARLIAAMGDGLEGAATRVANAR